MAADFIVRTTLPGHGRREWVDEQAAILRAKGATHMRLSHPIDKPDEMHLEGWRVKPDNMGPHPWEASA